MSSEQPLFAIIPIVAAAIFTLEYGIFYERWHISKWTLGLNILNFFLSLVLFFNGSFVYLILTAFSINGILVLLKLMGENKERSWTKYVFGGKTVGAISLFLALYSFEATRTSLLEFVRAPTTVLGMVFQFPATTTELSFFAFFFIVGMIHAIGFASREIIIVEDNRRKSSVKVA